MRSKNFLFFFLFCSILPAQNFDDGVSYFNKDDWQNAREVFETIIEKDATNYKAKEYLGDIAAHQKKWDEAIRIYKELVTVDDKNAEYHYKYGGALGLKALTLSKVRALGYIGDIKKHLNKAAALDKNHIDVRWALVELYVSLPGIVGGSEEKAMKYANQLLHISKVDGYLARGYVAEYNDKPKVAEKEYKKAIEVGGSLHTYEKLSDLYEGSEQPQKALDNYEKAGKKLRRNHLNYQIGKVCAQYNIELDKGLSSLHLYINNFSSKDGVPKSWAYFRIAQIYRHKKDKRNAYNWINKALKAKPDFKEARKEKDLILKMPSKK